MERLGIAVAAVACLVVSLDCGRIEASPSDGGTADTITCAPPAWGTATWINWNTDVTVRAISGYENAGRAFAIWSSIQSGVWVTKRQADATWSAPMSVSPADAAHPIVEATIATNGDSAIAVWTRSDGASVNPSTHLHASRYTIQTGWSAEVVLDAPYDAGSPLSTTSSEVQIAMDVNGDALLVWVESDWYGGEAAPPILSVNARPWVGSGWSDATQLVTTGPVVAAMHNPYVAFDTTGHALAAWSQAETSGLVERIQSSRYDRTAKSWSAPEYIDACVPNACAAPLDLTNSSKPRIAFDSAGDAFAVWIQHGGANQGFRPWAARFSGGVWGGVTMLDANGATNASTPQIAVDPSGNALATWKADVVDGILANRFSAGAWQGAVVLDSRDATESPTVALDDDGNGFVVWDDHSAVWGARFGANAFDPAVQLSPGCNCDGSYDQVSNTRLAITHGACPSALLVWTATSPTQVVGALEFR